MSATNGTSEKKSSKRSLLIVSGILAAIGISLFAYLMFYTAPETVAEQVEIIAVTDDGCIAQTKDGFPVNLGECDGQPGDIVIAQVDQKAKERQEMMNPSGGH